MKLGWEKLTGKTRGTSGCFIQEDGLFLANIREYLSFFTATLVSFCCAPAEALVNISWSRKNNCTVRENIMFQTTKTY